MARPLRVGIIGIVSAYSLHYAEDLARLPAVEVVGTAHLGRDEAYIRDSLALPWLQQYPKGLAEYERHFGVPVVASAEELYARGAEAVAVCTEDSLRHRYAVQALERGIHVFLPKPFASTLEEVAALRGALARSTATLVPSLPLRYHGLYVAAKQALGDAGLGEPLTVRGQIAHHLSFGPWKSDPTLAAGPEFESGFYTLDALCYLMGDEPARVYAAGRNFLHRDMPTFDAAKVLVQFTRGGLASADFYCGNHFPFPSQELELVARDGGLRIERDYPREGLALRIFTKDGMHTETRPGDFRRAELAHWLAICREGRRAEADALLAEGIRTLQVLIAFKQAWQTGREVALPLPGGGGETGARSGEATASHRGRGGQERADDQ
jgi:predicted dehydrogenase